jgi:hypothetical protein
METAPPHKSWWNQFSKWRHEKWSDFFENPWPAFRLLLILVLGVLLYSGYAYLVSSTLGLLPVKKLAHGAAPTEPPPQDSPCNATPSLPPSVSHPSCSAKALTGTTILLTCRTHRTVISLDRVVTLPSTSQLGKDAVAAVVID